MKKLTEARSVKAKKLINQFFMENFILMLERAKGFTFEGKLTDTTEIRLDTNIEKLYRQLLTILR